MKRRAQQSGAALMAMLAVLVLGAAWWGVTVVSTPINRTADNRMKNARILQEAKSALMGYVAHQAAMSGENDPGKLPCPEAAGNIGTGNEGIAAGNCAATAIGRLPWRTLGLDKWRDAAGEPLWYVVSPGWHKPNAATNTVINSNCTNLFNGMACTAGGQLDVDGIAGAAVALIIAPGGPVQVVASANCTARNQTRTVPSPAIDLRDYLECQNGTLPADAGFATSGPAGSFNDQMLAITATELLPVIESAVADRFAREFGPSMRYCGGGWAPCTGAGAAVYYPFAATFGDPAASNFQGALNNPQGLLPLSFGATSNACAPLPAPQAPFCSPPAACNPALDNRCADTLITYRSNPTITQTGSGSAGVAIQGYNCAVAGTPSTLSCTLNVRYPLLTAQADRWVTFEMQVTSNNIGMALRQLNAAVQMTGVQTAGAGTVNAPFGYTVNSATMNVDGSAMVTLSTRVAGASGGLLSDLLCGLGVLSLLFDCDQQTISLPFMWLDQPVLYTTNVSTAWFYRNGWDQLMYYAVSAGNAPSGTGTCTIGGTCLSAFGLNPGNTQRALVIVPGQAIGPQLRPPAAVTDWLEGGNANLPVDAAFWHHDPNLMFNRTFNDRLVVIEAN